MKKEIFYNGGIFAPRATFVLSILSLAPNLSSPRGVPQVDYTRLQTFRAKHKPKYRTNHKDSRCFELIINKIFATTSKMGKKYFIFSIFFAEPIFALGILSFCPSLVT